MKGEWFTEDDMDASRTSGKWLHVHHDPGVSDAKGDRS